MKNYSVKVSAVFDIQAESKDEAIEIAADYVRGFKPKDFEYDVEEE